MDQTAEWCLCIYLVNVFIWHCFANVVRALEMFRLISFTQTNIVVLEKENQKVSIKEMEIKLNH